MTRKAVLATFGSLGDLHPFIALARALQQNGIEPVIACAAEYQSKVEAAGIAFFPVRPSFEEIERELGMNRAQLTRRAIKRSDFLFRKVTLPHVRHAYEDMMRVTEDAEFVLTSCLAFGARLAAEKRGIDWIAVVLQPMMFFSAYDPPLLPKAQWLTRLLRFLGPEITAAVFGVAKPLLRPMFAPVHRVRAEIGLAPTRACPFFEGQYSKAGAIALYSGLLGRIEPDFPTPAVITGFAGFDSEDGRDPAIGADLALWLDRGDAPFVFTLGSLIVNSPGDFYRESVAAAGILNRRAVLLVGAGFAGEFAGLQSSGVFVCAYAPHSLLFPRATAVIHHGGIGTLAQAMRAGRPQLIVPFYADQVDNAARAVRLRLARVLAPSQYRAERAARELGDLLACEETLAAASAAGSTIESESEGGAACAARFVVSGRKS